MRDRIKRTDWSGLAERAGWIAGHLYQALMVGMLLLIPAALFVELVIFN